MIEHKSLTALGLINETDKAYSHNFTNFYDSKLAHLRAQKINLLEIGVAFGNSLKMWRDYFYNGTIYGADNLHTFEGERIITALFDQADEKQYDNLFPGIEFDVIVDDASHYMFDQQFCFVKMFKRLRPGGIYILEDLHTSMSSHYDEKRFQPLLSEGKLSTLTLLEKILKKESDYKNFYVCEESILEVIKDIESLEIFHNKPTVSVTSVIIKNGIRV